MGNGMNKVLSGLYVGNYRDSKDPVQLEKFKITHILSIHDAARRHHSDKHYLCIMASDSPDQNLTQYFSLCNDFIHAARLRDGNVLIHCLAGMSRSVTVAVAYIMSVTPLTWREALKVVRAGRAVANPNLGFQRQLQDFETYKLVEERRRLKERYPSLALADNDLAECRVMLDSYQTMLSQRTICEGKCAMGRQCPTEEAAHGQYTPWNGTPSPCDYVTPSAALPSYTLTELKGPAQCSGARSRQPAHVQHPPSTIRTILNAPDATYQRFGFSLSSYEHDSC
ncbi:dual specificity protein phosphatase 22-like isoform X2 [Epargyreus clarus]|uniref:dual specificity protein phosphatase 22-like isoform X2 n=1 Tax=Epargyreus clarus TaxID=520877 RepID=UPI003C302953